MKLRSTALLLRLLVVSLLCHHHPTELFQTEKMKDIIYISSFVPKRNCMSKSLEMTPTSACLTFGIRKKYALFHTSMKRHRYVSMKWRFFWWDGPIRIFEPTSSELSARRSRAESSCNFRHRVKKPFSAESFLQMLNESEKKVFQRGYLVPFLASSFLFAEKAIAKKWKKYCRRLKRN